MTDGCWLFKTLHITINTFYTVKYLKCESFLVFFSLSIRSSCDGYSFPFLSNFVLVLLCARHCKNSCMLMIFWYALAALVPPPPDVSTNQVTPSVTLSQVNKPKLCNGSISTQRRVDGHSAIVLSPTCHSI